MHRGLVSGASLALERREPVPDVVVGAGHNGLVAACYLARAGRDVLVLEALDGPGGGSRTAETIPGFRFDLHSVAHNMINMTSIPDELDLAGAGLVYQEMDPFTVAIHEDGRRVRFHRSVDATVESIAEVSSHTRRAKAGFPERVEYQDLGSGDCGLCWSRNRTSTRSSGRRSSRCAIPRRAARSGPVSGGCTMLRGQSRRARTTLTSAA
jgi:choline dehydrogenase-like flavoprotein